MGISVIPYDHDDNGLWDHVGAMLTSRTVVAELGGPVYSTPGTTWMVAMVGGACVGFACYREHRGEVWHDYAYTLPEHRGMGVFSALVAAREAHLSGDARPRRVVVTEKRWPQYEARGWSAVSKRGAWVYGSRAAA